MRSGAGRVKGGALLLLLLLASSLHITSSIQATRHPAELHQLSELQTTAASCYDFTTFLSLAREAIPFPENTRYSPTFLLSGKQLTHLRSGALTMRRLPDRVDPGRDGGFGLPIGSGWGIY